MHFLNMYKFAYFLIFWLEMFGTNGQYQLSREIYQSKHGVSN